MSSNPPVPHQSKRNILVTSALPYVNNYPHLGNIIGAVLSADVYARYERQRQANVIYVCGTDEYGTATETKAQQEGLTPRQLCDKYHLLHKEVYDWFDLQFDIFGRTSTDQQREVVQEVFWDVYNKGFISQDTIVQLYCDTVCKRFLADRYVHGTCPNCGYEDARGDQCDNCGHMLNPDELIKPKCSTCENPPVPRETTHLFLDLPRIQPKLKEWVETASMEGKWTNNALSMTETWLRDGLKQRCITRDLKWGVPVPLEGFTDKVFYVWFDAPIGYPSITAALCGDRWREWWQPESCDVKLVQFMGKDNVPFHTIVFPGSLLATEKKWTMLHHISTTEYLNYESGKFSKSRGIGVFGNDAMETGIPSEVWRYYLLVNRPEGSDSVFTWDDLAVKNNDELINTLGNYINRTVTFLYKYFNGVVPESISDDQESTELTNRVNANLSEYLELMDKVSLKAGLKKAMAVAHLGNLYLQRKAPWKLMKEGNVREAGSSLTFSANLALLVTVLLEPFLGTKFSQKVFSQLGLTHTPGENNIIPDRFSPTHWLLPGAKTSKPEILFTALTPAQIEGFRRKHSGVQKPKDDGQAFKLDLRVAQIVDVKEHPESDKSYIARVNVGEDVPRTVVAGLRGVYTKDQLQERRVVLVCNLAKANLAGISSEGMVLVAEKKKATELLSVPAGVVVGEKVFPEGIEISLAKDLDRKGFQAASKLLRVGKGGEVLFDKRCRLGGADWRVSAGEIPEGGKIK